jgi:hypothetical protein
MSDSAAASVSSLGLVTAVTAGTTSVIAKVENQEGSAAIEVAPSPRSVDDLTRFFQFSAVRANVKAFSSISASFSEAHVDHAQRLWMYFSRVFARSVGNRTELYYTQDQGLYTSVFQFCPSIVIPGARQVTTCFDERERFYQWFIIPYQVPDFGTLQHELSHSFLYGTYFGAEDFPWLKEGLGMYYESGQFEGDILVMRTPIPYLTNGFRRWHSQGQLVPLEELLNMPRQTFYSSDPTKVYAQAGLLLFYLAQRHEATLNDLIVRLNRRQIDQNRDILTFLMRETGLNFGQLERSYTDYALTF